MEKTFVLIKPDAVERSLIGKIITIYETHGLKVVRLRLVHADEETATRHYEEHLGRPYFPGLIAYITRSPLIAMVLEGDDAIAMVRKLNGKTNPAEAEEGTVRGLYGLGTPDNSVHSSDTPENAERETAIWFGNA